MQPHSFELEEDTSGFKGYVRGGIVAQFKRPKQLAFQSLQQAIESPGEFLFSDFSKIERPGLLHVAFQALDAFQVSSSSPGFSPQGACCATVFARPATLVNSTEVPNILEAKHC